MRERYQDVKVKEFGDKWRIDYWDYTTTPRTKRGKKWTKKYVPTKREAQKHADEFMEQVNERNNSPQLQRWRYIRFAGQDVQGEDFSSSKEFNPHQLRLLSGYVFDSKIRRHADKQDSACGGTGFHQCANEPCTEDHS